MDRIAEIYAREILDSRGNPTVEVEVYTDSGAIGRACVPSGASTGKYEAVELRDGDKQRFIGKGVSKAIYNINKILNEELEGYNIFDQIAIDNAMIRIDGTKNKSNLGANAIVGVSLAVAKAAALTLGMPLFKYIGGLYAHTLPIPMMNILNGGKHADNNIDIQEFMIMPVGAKCFSDALRIGTEIFHNLKNVLKENGFSTNVGDEGGFAPNLSSNDDAVKLILKAIEKAGYKPGDDVCLAIDAAASEFYNEKEKIYYLKSIKQKLNSNDLINYYKDWIKKYPVISIEDGLAEDDWKGWKKLNSELGNKIQIVGDDIFVTNINRLQKGVKEKCANSILIKVNQIGTLTETIQTVEYAQSNSFTTIISHRSGETEDTTIADLAVALNTGLIKTGSISRTDRIAKYNQLLRIEEMLGETAYFPGKNFKFYK